MQIVFVCTFSEWKVYMHYFGPHFLLYHPFYTPALLHPSSRCTLSIRLDSVPPGITNLTVLTNQVMFAALVFSVLQPSKLVLVKFNVAHRFCIYLKKKKFILFVQILGCNPSGNLVTCPAR